MSENKFLYIGVSVIFLFCIYKDASVSSNIAEKEIPVTNVGIPTKIGHTVKILYCYSCGYKKVFDDYSVILQKQYPDLFIYGANYDPPGYQMSLASFLGLAKIVLIICILMKINFFEKLGLQTPFWWNWCLENKVYSISLLFFTINAIEGQLISTGAFEISFNNIPIWSKLETGRIPQPNELFEIIESQFLLENTPPESSMNSEFPK